MHGFLSKESENFSKFHVSKDIKECSNSKQNREICLKCEQVCPKGIMNRDTKFNVSFDECLDCNLCAVVCPTRAISFSSLNAGKIKEILNSREEIVKIACYESSNNKNLELYCISSLPWETIAHLALSKKIVFDKSRCLECKSSCLLEIFDKNLQRVKEFLGDKLFEERIFISQNVFDEQISRRRAFNDISKLFVHSDINIKYSNKISRKNMFKQLKFYAKNKTFGFKTLRINADKCCACKICETVCPFNAISIDKNTNTFTLHHSVLRCNECGLCQITCLFGAIESFDVVRSKNSLTSYFDNQVMPNKCESCGEFIPKGRTKCLECESKEYVVNLFN